MSRPEDRTRLELESANETGGVHKTWGLLRQTCRAATAPCEPEPPTRVRFLINPGHPVSRDNSDGFLLSLISGALQGTARPRASGAFVPAWPSFP